MTKLNRRFAALAASALALAAAAPAAATTITFDEANLTNGTSPAVANGYQGLNWNNIALLDAVTYGAQGTNGYTTNLISQRNVAWVYSQTIGSFSAATPFTLNDAYFGAAWNDNMTVTVRGLTNNVQAFMTSFIVNTTAPTHQVFDWSGLTSVTIQASGGVDAGTFGNGNHIVLDNLTINSAVPEPATWAMMLVGFGMMGAAMRYGRRTTRAAVAA